MHGKAIAYTTLVAASMLLGSSGLSYAQTNSELAELEPSACKCFIEYIDDPVLAASESGILEEIASEGTKVIVDQIVARMDEQDAKLRRDAAYFIYRSNLKNVESDIRERYAVAQYKAAQAAFRQVVEANARSPKAVSQAELDRRKLEMEAAKLSIENAQHETEVSKVSVKKDESEYKLATAMALRHRIKSPINGVVVQRLKQIGEFVQAGEELIQVVRLDRLRAIGEVPLSLMSPAEAKGRSVSIEVQAGDATKLVTGTITHSDTTIAYKEYKVWVEFDNPEGYPIRPGMQGKMTIN